MSPDVPTLAFLLDSPLQSWGESSRFNRRGTGPHPTKSGVVALIACARGIDKHSVDEAELLKPLAALTLTTALVPRIQLDWRGNPRLTDDGSPRTHRPLRLTDYHTIGGGFEDKRDPLRKPRKAGGGVFDTVQTWRDYLLDTRFAVFLQGDPNELARVRDDFANPKWGLWLGRKSCIPAVPIHPSIHPDSAAAWTWAMELSGYPLTAAPERFDRYEEILSDEAPDFHLLDQPVSFARREFHARAIRHHRP